MESAFIDASEFIPSPGLLIVTDKMLRSGNDLLALDPSDVLGSHDAGKKRIFPERLKIAAALRHAHQVNHRPQGDMNAFATVLSTDDRSVLPGQTRVPGCRQQNRSRQRRDVLRAIGHTGRPILQMQSRNAQATIVRAITHTGPGETVDHRNFFLECHLAEEQTRAVVSRKGWIHPGGRGRRRCLHNYCAHYQPAHRAFGGGRYALPAPRKMSVHKIMSGKVDLNLYRHPRPGNGDFPGLSRV